MDSKEIGTEEIGKLKRFFLFRYKSESYIERNEKKNCPHLISLFGTHKMGSDLRGHFVVVFRNRISLILIVFTYGFDFYSSTKRLGNEFKLFSYKLQ